MRRRGWARTESGQKQMAGWDFPGGPVAKILGFQHRGPKFDPWSGN